MTLNKENLVELNDKLLEEKARLEEELKRFATPTETPGDFKTRFNQIGPDQDENASEVEEYTDNLALEDNLEKQLKSVLGALERVESGSYGKCGNCDQEIDIERLRAYPSAEKCMKCK